MRGVWAVRCECREGRSLLRGLRRSGAAAAVVDEARDIAGQLRYPPLLDRAEAIERAKPRIRA